MTGLAGWGLGHPVVLGVLAAAAVGAWELARWRAVRRALRARARVYALPVDGFDPDPELVRRFAAQLADVARPSTFARDRAGRAVRVRLESGAHRRMLFSLELPADRLGVLRSALPYGVELREPASMDLPGLAAIGATRPGEREPEHDGDDAGVTGEPLTEGSDE